MGERVLCSLDPLPELWPGPVGDLGGLNTSCLTRKETLVTVLVWVTFQNT